MSEESHGTKELGELLDGVDVLVLRMLDVLDDGIEIREVADLLSDSEFKDAMEKAGEGLSGLGAEVKDLDATEIVTLVMKVAMMVPGWIDKVKALKEEA